METDAAQNRPSNVVVDRTKTVSLWPLAMAAMVLFVCLLVGFIFYQWERVSGDVLKAVVDGAKISSQTTTVINTYLGDLRPEKKLVVLQTSIDAQVKKWKESYLVRGTIYLGTTIVNLRANGNQIQYYVPLEGLTKDDFRVDFSRRVIHVTIPKPMLDEDFVDVQTDPQKIEVETEVGWSALDRYEGAKLRDDAKQALRTAIIDKGNNDENLLNYAADHALTVFRDQIAGRFATALGGDWVADVRFRADPMAGRHEQDAPATEQTK